MMFFSLGAPKDLTNQFSAPNYAYLKMVVVTTGGQTVSSKTQLAVLPVLLVCSRHSSAASVLPNLEAAKNLC